MHEQVNQRMQALINQCHEPLLREVMAYSALGEGKRLRPLLLLSACEAVSGGYCDTALDFACAVEMIHAYSLAHDDLPAMDNDDFRRGRPTCHRAYNEAMAILAGDGLLSLAVEVMAGRVDSSPGSAAAAQALNCVIQGAGVNGMVAGQVSDIIHEGKAISAETLAAIHHRKTGSLITACLKAGAVLGCGDAQAVEKMAKLGSVLGLAFQIRDDILDVTSTAEDLGKPVGSDSKNQKATYVSVHGMEAAEAEYRRLSREAFEIVESARCKTGTLGELVSKTVSRVK